MRDPLDSAVGYVSTLVLAALAGVAVGWWAMTAALRGRRG